LNMLAFFIYWNVNWNEDTVRLLSHVLFPLEFLSNGKCMRTRYVWIIKIDWVVKILWDIWMSFVPQGFFVCKSLWPRTFIINFSGNW
jgi:hypothetical protein